MRLTVEFRVSAEVRIARNIQYDAYPSNTVGGLGMRLVAVKGHT